MNINELNGVYPGKVVDAGLAKASNGNEQVALLCELGGDGPEKGLKLTYFGSFSEKSFDITVKALRTAGWSGTDLAEVDRWKEVVPSPPDVDFVIEQEEYEGKQQTRVRWINSRGNLGVKERLGAAEAQTFAQRMKGKLLAFDQANRGPKNNGAPPRQSPPKSPAGTKPANSGDLDIPF